MWFLPKKKKKERKSDLLKIASSTSVALISV